MPGFLLHQNATMTCTHSIPVTMVPAQARVLVSAQPVATTGTQLLVGGCPFTVPGPKPQPCVKVQWQLPTTRVLVSGLPALVQPTPGPGAGICQSPGPGPIPIPNGPPIVGAMQARVFAT